MDSRACRFPFTSSRTTSLSPSSMPLGASGLNCRSRTLAGDGFARSSSSKLDSDLESPRFGSSRDYRLSEGHRSSWKMSAAASCDRSWTDSPLRSRSKLGPSEQLSSYSGFLNRTPDSDLKRAKIAYCNRTSYSREPCTSTLSGAHCGPDSSWQSHSTRSRSSSSSPSEGVWSRRDPEGLRTTALGSSSLTSSLYPERVTSSYAQGARPKESFYTSGQPSTAARPRPARYEPLPLSHDPSRPATPWAGPSRSRYVGSTGPSETVAGSASYPRQQEADSGSPEGRCTTRQLLSRLASSMSSTLFSRRPSQDSGGSTSASRSVESLEDYADVPRAESTPASSGNSSPEPSQGLPFLRRRRQGYPRGTEVDAEPQRVGPFWLSSTLRSRCTPLLSCRRREDLQEEEARPSYQSSPFPSRRRASLETKASDQEGGEAEDEAESEAAGAIGHSGAMGASSTTIPCPPQAGRARRMAGVSSNSLFHVSVSPSLESSLPDNVMITVDIVAARRNLSDKEKPASSRDPEKLRKIKESLLLEESDEEGDLCRICQMGEESPSNPLIAPCRCTGSLQYVHQDCMKKWLSSKVSSGSDLDTITTCELCKEKLQLNIDNFDINELYRTRERSENEFISCGLYLVVLLHLCEQRFSDVLGAANDTGFFNMTRTLHEYMDELESSNGDSEDEMPDHRPSVDFCDLDNDDEEDY